MDPALLSALVAFIAMNGCCFGFAHTRTERRLRALEARMAALEANPTTTAAPVVIPSAPAFIPPLQQQPQYYPPATYYPPLPAQPRSAEDPLPVTYTAYYQNPQRKN